MQLESMALNVVIGRKQENGIVSQQDKDGQRHGASSLFFFFFFSSSSLFSSFSHVFLSHRFFFSFLFFSVKLGDMYVNGEGVPTNAKVAAKHYRVAAEKNHVRGMYLLGRTLCEGGGNKMLPNPSSGVPWLRKALKNGNKNAEKFLESLALLK